jgi:TAT (twin-arginine translocation) pathway signal sequence
MATRRDVLRWAGATGGAVLLGGCARGAGTAPQPPASTDLLYVATGAGLAVLRADRKGPVVEAVPAIATADWRHVVSTVTVGAGTKVTVTGVSGERVVTEHVVPGRLAARAATAGGKLIALVTASTGETGGGGEAPYRPAGRDRTTISVLDAGGERYRFDLAGCLEPDAFDAGGGRLFVLEYLPPANPDSYRVRMLDLATATIGPLAPFPKPLPPQDEDIMWGEGRQAVYDERRQILFTLYTRQRPQAHAFVHALNLTAGWAYCVDLPEPFGQGPAAGHTIARAPGSGSLYAFDASSGAIAVIDPDGLSVVQMRTIAPASGAAASVTTPDGQALFLAAGTALTRLDTSGLAVTDQWRVAAPVRGVAAGPDGSRSYVGQPEAVLALDPRTGAVLDRIAVPGLVNLRHAIQG